MAWQKLGLIFDISKHSIPWLKSHAMTPTPLLVGDTIRVFFTGRDKDQQSRISFIDLDPQDPRIIRNIQDKPVLDVSKIGTFDDSGTICTSAVKHNKAIYLYYTAYSKSVLVPYRNAIGLAVSSDGGETFVRKFEGPVVDRSKTEPYFTISPWVLCDESLWHMWYASATNWVVVNGKPESVYHIKYAYSADGLDWHRDDLSCIHPLKPNEANARPTVIKERGTFKMWFCYRGSEDFRDGIDSYRIGYAEASAAQPTVWRRNDRQAGITCGPEDFDDKMQAYPAVIDVGSKRYLFYNGNGFGVNGICCAVWND